MPYVSPRTVALMRGATAVAAAPAGPVVLTYRGSYSNNTDLSAYTSASSDVGVASPDRIVVVAWFASSASSRTFTSATVGGASVTPVVHTSTGENRHLAIGYAALPSGATADIVVNYSGALSNFALTWWTITGTSQTTYHARNAASAPTATGTITAAAVEVPVGGAAIAVALADSTASSFTWSQTSGSGAARYDALITGSAVAWGGAYDTTAQAVRPSPLTVRTTLPRIASQS